MKPFFLLFLLPTVLTWKPILNPSTFSLSSLGTKGLNGLDHSTPDGGTVTYHGNAFLDEHADGHESIFNGGQSEERILSGKDDLFDSKIFGQSFGGEYPDQFSGVSGISVSFFCLFFFGKTQKLVSKLLIATR